MAARYRVTSKFPQHVQKLGDKYLRGFVTGHTLLLTEAEYEALKPLLTPKKVTVVDLAPSTPAPIPVPVEEPRAAPVVLAPTPGLVDEGDNGIGDMTVIQLRAALKSQGLSIKGNKAELMARFRQAKYGG